MKIPSNDQLEQLWPLTDLIANSRFTQTDVSISLLVGRGKNSEPFPAMVRQYRLDIHHQQWDEILLLLVKSFARARGKIYLIRYLLVTIALLCHFSVTIQMYCKMWMVSDVWPISCGKSNCSIWKCSRPSSVFHTPKRAGCQQSLLPVKTMSVFGLIQSIQIYIPLFF